ncbi:MAG: biotin--[Eubacteriaceae bacterium]|nr:biotin--[acetyl-CoA-carboxylase] ligase [Eubacteriaceae bacterium]
MIRDEVLKRLWEAGEEYVSGEEIAEDLTVSRTAVWKAVRKLREEGYSIDSVPNRGYRLSGCKGSLSVSGIRQYLRHRELDIEVHRSLTSTNTYLKKMAESGEAEGKVIVAIEQTGGRGRMGRKFFSPGGTGIYMSILLRPEGPVEKTVAITACAAVAVAETVEEISGRKSEIKWVNDVLLDGKKICGILTEGAVDCEQRSLDYAIIGIGINIGMPREGFPEELREVAGSLFDNEDSVFVKCRIAAGVLDRLMDLYGQMDEKTYMKPYKKRLFLTGKPVNILTGGKITGRGTVLGLGEDLSLTVRLDSGETVSLNSGEVSVRAASR